MADQSTRPEHPDIAFTIASTAIPSGVRCGACGRLHLPRRLSPIDDTSAGVRLRCSRCGATGTLEVDPYDPGHAEILHAIVSPGAP